MKYTLPTSSPWIVTIEGDRFVVPSTVARLLLQLDKARRNSKPKAAKVAKEKKSSKSKKPSKK